jgi:hypothetical protein
MSARTLIQGLSIRKEQTARPHVSYQAKCSLRVGSLGLDRAFIYRVCAVDTVTYYEYHLDGREPARVESLQGAAYLKDRDNQRCSRSKSLSSPSSYDQR